MSVITHEINLRLQRPVSFVYHYLLDSSNSASWDPRVTQAAKTSPGPIQVGTHFDLKMRWSWLELSVSAHITALEAPNYIERKGLADHYSWIERYRLEGDESHCTLHYQLDFFAHENLSRLRLLLAPMVRAQAEAAMRSLERSLHKLPSDWKPSSWTRWGDQLIVPGVLRFTRFGFAAAKSRWTGLTEDLSGRRIVITGASSGIGAAAAQQLAKLGADLVLVGRNIKKTKQVAETLERESGRRPEVEIADLSSMQEVQALAQRLLAKGEPIHALIHNAGALFAQRQLSAEGVEMSFATLLLSPFVLGEALLPLLKAGAPSRVINVSSGGMYTQALRLADLEFEREAFQGAKAYARAKRGLVDLTEVWAERWQGSGVSVHAMHPGWADTQAVAQSLPQFYEFTKDWLRTPEQAADGLVWLAAAPELEGSSGLFWLDRTPHQTAIWPGTRTSPEDQKALYQALEAYRARLLPN